MGTFNYLITGCLAILLAGGCATTRDSVLLGAGVGMGTGALTGIATSENKGGAALKGALIGGAVGALGSFIIHGALKSRDSRVRKDTLFNLENFGVSGVPTSSSGSPALTLPSVEETYIEPHIKGRKFVSGHKVWVISEDAKWIMDDEKKRKKGKK